MCEPTNGVLDLDEFELAFVRTVSTVLYEPSRFGDELWPIALADAFQQVAGWLSRVPVAHHARWAQ